MYVTTSARISSSDTRMPMNRALKIKKPHTGVSRSRPTNLRDDVTRTVPKTEPAIVSRIAFKTVLPDFSQANSLLLCHHITRKERRNDFSNFNLFFSFSLSLSFSFFLVYSSIKSSIKFSRIESY